MTAANIADPERREKSERRFSSQRVKFQIHNQTPNLSLSTIVSTRKSIHRTHMRRTLIFLALFGGCIAIALTEHDRYVPHEQLPNATQTFLSLHFPSCTIRHAHEELHLQRHCFTVWLDDLTVIEFDRHGLWTEVEGQRPLPASLIPIEVAHYVARQYPEHEILEMERSGHLALKVKLSDGTAMVFRHDGRGFIPTSHTDRHHLLYFDTPFVPNAMAPILPLQ